MSVLSEADTAVELIEVGPRDGLQNEPQRIETADKLALIGRMIDAGVRRMEVASFVNPRRVPQMADAEAVCAGLPQRADMTYIGLTLNDRGADRAIATGRIDQLGAVCVASDDFGIANQGQTSDESVAAAVAIVEQARSAGLTGQVTISTAFGCPFSGWVDPARVVDMAARLAACRPVEIALADTIGVAVPSQVSALFARVAAVVGDVPLRAHFHDTRGMAIANVWAAIGAGVRRIDGSLGGLGGCPFAPGATGNVASEDVLYLLDHVGYAAGVDHGRMVAANHWLGEVMQRRLPGLTARAPAFPPSG